MSGGVPGRRRGGALDGARQETDHYPREFPGSGQRLSGHAAGRVSVREVKRGGIWQGSKK